MKPLPRLYKNENIICKNTNKSNCIVKEHINNDVELIINDIFTSKGFPFDKKVLIKTKDKTLKTYLVTLSNNKVTTLNDEIININDIISIERL